MEFGSSCKNDYERITQSVFENMRRDPFPSKKSILGKDELVMDLRPFEKTKHVD
jgi:hypothetical protein